MEGVSIVYAYHNDVDDLRESLTSLYSTIDIEEFEVIVVNDGGEHKLEGFERDNLIHIDNPTNLGVGNAFDTGVSAAKYDIIFLSGADIFHSNNGYASSLRRRVMENDTALICTTCTSYVNSKRKHYGADILFKITVDDLPPSSKFKDHADYKSILEGKWRGKTYDGLYQIPCLMGAFYGVTKSWYRHIRGFELHYIWGSLEPYISLKSWILGGEVLIDTDIEISHKSTRTGYASKPQEAVHYNRLMIAYVVFGDYGVQFMEHYGQNQIIADAADIYTEARKGIADMRDYIEKYSVISPEMLHMKMVDLSSYHKRKKLKE